MEGEKPEYKITVLIIIAIVLLLIISAVLLTIGSRGESILDLWRGFFS